MIRRAAKIEIIDEEYWGRPFATIATIKSGNLSLTRLLTNEDVQPWKGKDGSRNPEPFTVSPLTNGARVAFGSSLAAAGYKTAEVLRTFFDIEYYPWLKVNVDVSGLSVVNNLPTSTVRVGEEVKMSNYRSVSMVELAGSALYVTLAAIHACGPENVLT